MFTQIFVITLDDICFQKPLHTWHPLFWHMKNTFIYNKDYSDTTTVSVLNSSPKKPNFFDHFIGTNPEQGNDLTLF